MSADLSELERIEASLREATAELRTAGAQVKGHLDEYFRKLESVGVLNALGALVHLEAAGLEAERWAAEQGSTYRSDPRQTETALALRGLLQARGVL